MLALGYATWCAVCAAIFTAMEQHAGNDDFTFESTMFWAFQCVTTGGFGFPEPGQYPTTAGVRAAWVPYCIVGTNIRIPMYIYVFIYLFIYLLNYLIIYSRFFIYFILSYLIHLFMDFYVFDIYLPCYTMMFTTTLGLLLITAMLTAAGELAESLKEKIVSRVPTRRQQWNSVGYSML